jgi:hypothetical protein
MVLIMALTYNLKLKSILVGDVLLVAYCTHATHNLLNAFYIISDVVVILGRSVELQFGTHDRLTIVTVVDVLPQFLGDETIG